MSRRASETTTMRPGALLSRHLDPRNPKSASENVGRIFFKMKDLSIEISSSLQNFMDNRCSAHFRPIFRCTLGNGLDYPA
jgi:hypothetical protein